MKLAFDGTQQFQLDAIESAVELFAGLPLSGGIVEVDTTTHLGLVPNPDLPTTEDLLGNLRRVQARNGLAPDHALKEICESIVIDGVDTEWSFPNFSVEMETGTGKTYVYLRSALELAKRFGFRKYIVVVPTVATCEGVMTMLRVTQEHFAELYPHVQYHARQYDSRNLSDVRQFALSASVELLIMTLDSFNKASNVIYRPADRLQGDAAVSLVRATHPILILDEPQNMTSALATNSLASLTPLFALRYSATHREPYNLFFRLTPLDAYRSGLVKQIEVAGVERELDANRAFIRLDSVRATGQRSTARLAIHVLRAGGGVRERVITVTSGTDVGSIAGRPEYAGYVVDEVNPATNTVRFVNDVEVNAGEAKGADRQAVFASQIRYTIREHFLRQERLRSRGIKVLSLFFVDRVANYEGEQPVIKKLFDAAFDELKLGFASWRERKASEVRAAYFASKRRRGGGIEYVDTTASAASENDRVAFELIMKHKERLLSFEEPVAFVFSHSALREGWDNPNVCQICTLNQAVSEMRKRQEIGRGVRLVVDQSGQRIKASECNVLTVVANESYEEYVRRYQQELADDLLTGSDAAPVANARRRCSVRLREAVLHAKEFRELWTRVARQTRYSVRLDTTALVDAAVSAIDATNVQPIRIRVTKGRLIAQESGFGQQVLTGARTLDIDASQSSVEQVIKTTLHLLEQGAQPFRITRKTLLRILMRSETKTAAFANPHGWATALARIVKEKATQQFVEHIEYSPTGQSHSAETFDETIEAWQDRVVESRLGLYDHALIDSTVERRLVESLEREARTLVYVKLPGWYRVETPIGFYNPDWAIAQEDVDEHGRVLGETYLVAETKGSRAPESLRPLEQRKISCAKAHFAALGVRFEVVTELGDLDEGKTSETSSA